MGSKIAVVSLIIACCLFSVFIWERFFSPEYEMNKRLQEYYHWNISRKCGVDDTDVMDKVWQKVSLCVDRMPEK